jgi:hypothetical protein
MLCEGIFRCANDNGKGHCRHCTIMKQFVNGKEPKPFRFFLRPQGAKSSFTLPVRFFSRFHVVLLWPSAKGPTFRFSLNRCRFPRGSVSTGKATDRRPFRQPEMAPMNHPRRQHWVPTVAIDNFTFLLYSYRQCSCSRNTLRGLRGYSAGIIILSMIWNDVWGI